MTGKLAAFLATIGQAANGIGAFMLSGSPAPFNWDAHDIGLALVWLGTSTTFVVLAIRRNMIPGVTTGIGNEAPGTTVTTTVAQETKTNP